MRLIGQNSVEVADAIREGDAGGRARRAPGRRRRAGHRAGRSATRSCTPRPTPSAPRTRSRPRRCCDARSSSTTPTTATPTRPAASSTSACSSSAAGSRRTSRSSTWPARCGWPRWASATRSSRAPRSTAACCPMACTRRRSPTRSTTRSPSRSSATAAVTRHARAALDRARTARRLRAPPHTISGGAGGSEPANRPGVDPAHGVVVGLAEVPPTGGAFDVLLRSGHTAPRTWRSTGTSSWPIRRWNRPIADTSSWSARTSSTVSRDRRQTMGRIPIRQPPDDLTGTRASPAARGGRPA